MTHRRTLFSGSILFVLAAIYYAFSFQIPVFKGLGSTPINARFVPQLWGGLLMFLSALLIVRGLKERTALKKPGTVVQHINWRETIVKNREVILVFVLLAVYITLLIPVGFLIMSTLFVFVASIILSPKGKRSWRASALTGITLAVFVDFVFVRLLHVMLPQGLIGF